jgi:hypothetical protein
MDNVERAQSELQEIAPPTPEIEKPKSLDDVIAGLRGFGLEDFEEILTVKSGSHILQLKISNIPTSDEMLAIQAADEFKGYLWIKRVKVELLSRSISWINGINLRNLPLDQRFVSDPTDKSLSKDYLVVLRNIIMGWGQEVVETLWKVVMNHSQNVEDRLKEQFPNTAIMTEAEARLIERAKKQMDDIQKVILEDQVSDLYKEEEKEKTN